MKNLETFQSDRERRTQRESWRQMDSVKEKRGAEVKGEMEIEMETHRELKKCENMHTKG